ncbi:hypothetical protein GCM10017620_34590 [Brevundimonas intermedia]|uniref:Uncharacterized protein n=1 Tax=Brevundimonas intermedia TaxID=74315 RepID=A0ABQ5TCB7_9CAUL|nr:hypothetical protein GCM10017620_34590 [Brevundimonas intermedia]
MDDILVRGVIDGFEQAFELFGIAVDQDQITDHAFSLPSDERESAVATCVTDSSMSHVMGKAGFAWWSNRIRSTA